MSKWGIAAAATGVVGTSVAGAYGIKALVDAENAETQEIKNEDKGWNIGKTHPEKTVHVQKCLKDTFGEWTPNTNSPSAVNQITDIQWDSSSQFNSCLIYNWEKKNKEQSWRDSIFHLIWALSRGDDGVAVDLTATVKPSSEMAFEGFAYVLKKTDGNWQATKKLGLKEESKALSSGEWKTKFPKMQQNGNFMRKAVDSAYWYFLDTAGTSVSSDLNNLHTTQWWKWKNSDNGIYEMKDWSSNLDVWWEHFFGKNRLDVVKLVEPAKEGGWDAN